MAELDCGPKITEITHPSFSILIYAITNLTPTHLPSMFVKQ